MSIEVKRIARTGALTILIVFGGLAIWSVTAPLHGAIVVGGLVKVANNRKTVQHNEGGIVKSILVHDGDSVTRGQTLIQLEDATVSAQYGIVRSALDAQLARQARLQTEATMSREISFPAELEERVEDADVAELQTRERALFATRRHSLDTQTRLINEQIVEIQREIRALTDQRGTELTAQALAVEELDSYEALHDKQYIAEVRILAQKRLVAEYQSRTEERKAEISRAEQRINDLRLRIAALGDEYVGRAAEELKESGVTMLELRERLAPTSDALARQSIVAPVSGKVIALRVHTEGATIGPREPLLDIVPMDVKLLIEAQAPLDAIKQLHIGQHADIRFSALPYRTTPMVSGKVSYISPDVLADQEGHTFYQVHIAPDADSLSEARITTLEPGMAAEVYIQTQSRTALQYIMRPISDSLRRAFREV